MAAGEGRSLFFTREGERIVHRLSSALKSEQSTVAKSHTDDEWHHLVRSALGPTVAWHEDNGSDEDGAPDIIRMVREALRAREPHDESQISFGATLLSNPRIDLIQIGPVRFEPRHAWLARKEAEGDLAPRTAERIRRAWSGSRLKKRRPSFHSMNENDILDTVGHSPYVCSVQTSRLAAKAAKTRGATAARLALAAISLIWESPSKTLAGFHLEIDAGMHHRRILRFIPDKLSFADRLKVGLPSGPGLKPQEWERLSKEYSADWTTIGTVLTYYLDPATDVTRPTVTTALLHALLWFYEGCRQSLDFLAVTNYVASLDALANGQGIVGIERLLTARLGYSEQAPVFKDGVPMQQLVKELYKSGRSRTIHGNNLNLRSDWSATREQCEKLVRLCLLACLSWPGETQWMRARRRSKRDDRCADPRPTAPPGGG